MGEYAALEEAGEDDFGVGPDEEQSLPQGDVDADNQEEGPINMVSDRSSYGIPAPR